MDRAADKIRRAWDGQSEERRQGPSGASNAASSEVVVFCRSFSGTGAVLITIKIGPNPVGEDVGVGGGDAEDAEGGEV